MCVRVKLPAPCENVSTGSESSEQPAHPFHCPITESMDTTECTNGEPTPG